MFNFDRIKALAKENGLSITFICGKLGMTKTYFLDLRKTGRDVPDDKMEILADLLHTTPDYLCNKTDVKEKTLDNHIPHNGTMFIERVEALLKEKKIQKKDFLSDLGLARTSFGNWRDRGTVPSGATLQKIADYLEVSVDYLLGKEETSDISIQTAYNAAPEEIKAAIRKLLDV